MDKRLVILAVAGLAFTTRAVTAQLSAPDQTAIEAYRAAIAAAQSAKSPRAIENAFSVLVALRQALLRVTADRSTVLESLSEADFGALRRSLPGVVIEREEVVLVEPDTGYFARLARAKGTDADRAFFTVLKATYPESVWPVYLQQQTDYSGCTRFGSMSLVDTYRAWSEFRTKHPDRYVSQANAEADRVVKELATSTCACGNADGIVQELEQFQARFAQSPVRSEIDTRLKALRTQRSNIRTNCISG